MTTEQAVGIVNKALSRQYRFLELKERRDLRRAWQRLEGVPIWWLAYLADVLIGEGATKEEAIASANNEFKTVVDELFDGKYPPYTLQIMLDD